MTRRPVHHWLRNAARQPSSHLDLLEYWDAVVLGESLPSDPVDPTMAMTIQRVHSLDDTPLPDAAFAARLERTLLRGNLPAPSAPVAAAPSPQGSYLDIPEVPMGRPAAPPQRVVLHLAEMAALLAIVLASVVVTLRVGPLASPDRVDAPVELAPGITDETLLLHARFDSFPDGVLSAGVDRWVLQPGAEVLMGSQESGSEGPSAYLIETGTLTVRPDGPIAVTRSGSTTLTNVEAGAQTELHAGDRGFTPLGITLQWRNTGTAPVRILEAKVKRGDIPADGDGVLNYSVISESPFAKPGYPIVMTVLQVTLQPRADLAASAVPGLEMLKVEAGRLVAIDVDGNGTPLPPVLVGDATRVLRSFPPGRVFRSGTDQPVSLLLVTITDAHPLGGGA